MKCLFCIREIISLTTLCGNTSDTRFCKKTIYNGNFFWNLSRNFACNSTKDKNNFTQCYTLDLELFTSLVSSLGL